MAHDPAPLEIARNAYTPQLPSLLREPPARLTLVESAPTSAVADAGEIRSRFPRTFGRPSLSLVSGAGPAPHAPLRAGVVFSGGQAPGGHNVVAGLFDGLRAAHERSGLIGFLGGPRGILEHRVRELDAPTLQPYRNAGGFDLIGSGRDKLESVEQLAACRATCEALGLDGLVVIGGDDSNTNAALLAEYLVEQGSALGVVGVPKTIDGDLKGGGIEASFGFDTATRVYSELIGNVCRDALSAGKYWHFVKLMGRSASHVTLECALQTRPNLALIGEEIERDRLTLEQVVRQVVEVVAGRAARDRSYGVCLIPEGLVEFVPEMRELVGALNRLVARRPAAVEDASARAAPQDELVAALPGPARALFGSLPPRLQRQLLLDRDAHGNVQVSKIDTERLLIDKVTDAVNRLRAAGRFAGAFQVQGHFFGYEGRCAAPTDFDADYGYALGRWAALLLALRRTGYLCGVQGLAAPPDAWRPIAVPLTSLMRVETRKGRRVPVIGKALVRLDAEPFSTFAAERPRWALDDAYRYPGAIQYFGPPAVRATPPLTLQLEHRTVRP